MRRLVWIALLARALPAEDPPAGACTVKGEGLASPRRRLRYRGRLHVTQPLELVLWQEMRRETQGDPPQKHAGPRVTLGLEVTLDRFENGVTSFVLRVAKAEASGGTVSAEQVTLLRRAASALQGLRGEGAVAEDGSGARLNWHGVERLPPDAQGIAEEARATLASAFVPLPRNPMGEGGAWVVKVGGGERTEGPVVKEISCSCSLLRRAPRITVSAEAESERAVEAADEPSKLRRTRARTVVSRELRLVQGELFPSETGTTTLSSYYGRGEARFVDRHIVGFELRGSEAAPPFRAVKVVHAGGEPRVEIAYSGSHLPRVYAIEYGTSETVAADGRVDKRGQPRARAVVRVEEWSDPHSAEEVRLIGWSVVSARLAEEAGRAGSRTLEAVLRGLRGLQGGGSYGRSCTEAPQLWLEFADGTSPELERAADRLCETIEWSMFPVPETEDARAPRLGKGGLCREADLLPVAGAKPLERVLEYAVTEILEDSFTVSVRSEDLRAPLGPAALEGLPEGSAASLLACSSRRTGSWTIAKDHTMPLKANVEDVLDRDYEVVDADGSKRRIRFHTVRTVTIEALAE